MQLFLYLDKREVLQQEYSQPPILPSSHVRWVVNIPLCFRGKVSGRSSHLTLTLHKYQRTKIKKTDHSNFTSHCHCRGIKSECLFGIVGLSTEADMRWRMGIALVVQSSKAHKQMFTHCVCHSMVMSFYYPRACHGLIRKTY